MAVKYTLDFSSNAGSDITYELDILDEDFTGTPTNIKGQAEPVEIDWKSNDDVYSPILSSKMAINLLIEDGDVVDDFNSGGVFKYEARLRWRDGENNPHNIWRGWIQPNDGNELIGSYPISVSYIATDYLGHIPGVVRAPNERGEVLLLHYILDALEATGLGLDVRIDSSIRDEDDNDALTTAMVDERAWIDADTAKSYPTNADSKMEVLEGILASFNCSVRQSNGIFYIVNNSLYEGTGDSESVTWKTYEYNTSSSDKIDGTNYESVADVTEDVRYDLDSSDTTDLFIQNESLFFIPRVPLGSVEARFSNLRPKNLIPNWNFDDGTSGWTAGDDSIDTTLSIDDDGGLDGSQAIMTGRSRKESNSNSEVWFEISPGAAISASREFGHKLTFKWYSDFLNDNAVRAHLKIQVYCELENNISQTRFAGSSNWFDWFKAILGNSSGLIETTTANRLYYCFSDNRWKLDSENKGFWDWEGVRNTSVSDGGWYEEEIDLSRIGNVLTGPGGGAEITGNPKFYIRFMYPEVTNDNDRRLDNSTTNVNVRIDDISVTGVYSGDDAAPIFERAQDDYTLTERYEPRVIGDNVLDQQFYEILDITEFWESNQNVSNDASRSLEQIVTNQKLKDYQGQFYFYSADLINNNSTPIGIHNKIKLGLTTETRANSFIMNGGRFMPKSNVMSITMYEPNQTNDTDFGTFSREDITLIGKEPPLRDSLVDYVISFDIDATDDDDNTIDNGIIPADNRYGIILSSRRPGDIVDYTFDLNVKDGYEFDGNPVFADAGEELLPAAIQDYSIERIGSLVRVNMTIVIPEEDEYEVLYIDGGVDVLVGDNSRVILEATDSLTNASIQQGTGEIVEVGPVGATENFLYYIQPDSTYQMLTSALTVTLDSVKDGDNSTDTDVAGVINSDDIELFQAGTGVIVSIPFTYVNVSPVYAKLTISGTATTIPSTSTVTAQVTVTEAGTDTANWSITDSDITLTCIPGTPVQYIFELNPESGRTLPPGNVSMGSIEESWLGSYYVTGDNTQNTEALIFLEGTCPTSNQTASATITATTTAGTSGDDLNSYGITMTAPTNTTINGDDSPTLQLQEGQTSDIVVSLEANTGFSLGTIAIDEDSLPTGIAYNGRTDYGDLGEVEISDFFFTITGQASDDTGNAIAFTGATADANDKYTLLINIRTNDESGNAVTDKTIIRVPFGLHDAGEAITAQTFNIYSSDETMEYSATDDVSFTTTSASDNDANLSVTATSVTTGVILATITGTLPDDNFPDDGIAEVDVVVGGAAPDLIDATTGSFSGVTDDNVRANTGTTSFTITANGAWKLRSYDEDTLIPLNTALADFNPRSGVAGTYTITARPKIALGSNGRLVNSNGTDNASGATSGTVNVYLVADSQSGSYDDTNLASESFTWTSLGGADDNLVSSLEIQSIRVLTQSEFDALSGTDSDNTLYLISS